MRLTRKNRTRFWYSSLEGKKPLKDSEGYETGEYELVYSMPTLGWGSVSAARGETQTRQFGEQDEYDKVLVLDHYGPTLDEQTRIWLREPDEGVEHDYIVKKVALSHYFDSYALTKVNVG